MGTDNYMQMMIDSLKMKEKLLAGIVELNEEQTKIASGDDFDEEAFYENIKEKGEIIDNITRLDEGFNSLFNRIKEELETDRSRYTDEIKELQELIKKVTELGVKVEAQEARNKVLVEKRFNRMKSDVKTAQRSTQMANAYYKNQNKISAEPHFMDSKK